MKVLREGKMISPITFECGACECKFIAGQGEYKHKYIPFDEWEIYECECPYCKSLV
jgi:hypothetical protein